MTSTIKVNNIQNQCGANIINESSNTITIGASGDTIALASGASQTGFGREGSVDWQTGSIKTSTFTATSGEGYFINSGSALTMNLPAGSAGAIVAVSDYARNFATYNFTISPNGSEKIGGENNDLTLNVDGQAATFVYVDSTKGWVNVQNAQDTQTGVNPYIVATGGTIVTCGDFKTHVFTGPGTFCVSNAGIARSSCSGDNRLDYFVVGGAGAGGGPSGSPTAGGGGGAGGFRLSNAYSIPAPTMSPLANPTSLTASVAGVPVTVGAGGSGSGPFSGRNGNNSVFSTITSALGGTGGDNRPSNPSADRSAGPGGSGGGASGGNGIIGTGNTPPVSPPQGNNGGSGHDGTTINTNGGGGGGAAAVGANASSANGGNGGIGSFIADGFIGPTAPSYGTAGPVSSVRYFAGGGGGATNGSPPNPGCGGAGGGGNAGAVGTVNTGGGGGSNNNGGSGIVMIRYRFQN